jgi:hypothetical protein
MHAKGCADSCPFLRASTLGGEMDLSLRAKTVARRRISESVSCDSNGLRRHFRVGATLKSVSRGRAFSAATQSLQCVGRLVLQLRPPIGCDKIRCRGTPRRRGGRRSFFILRFLSIFKQSEWLAPFSTRLVAPFADLAAERFASEDGGSRSSGEEPEDRDKTDDRSDARPRNCARYKSPNRFRAFGQADRRQPFMPHE